MTVACIGRGIAHAAGDSISPGTQRPGFNRASSPQSRRALLRPLGFQAWRSCSGPANIHATSESTREHIARWLGNVETRTWSVYCDWLIAVPPAKRQQLNILVRTCLYSVASKRAAAEERPRKGVPASLLSTWEPWQVHAALQAVALQTSDVRPSRDGPSEPCCPGMIDGTGSIDPCRQLVP